MAGDDRQFDPKAPVKASRAQIYFDPARCAIRTTVNTSRVILPGPLNDTTIYQPHRLNKVNAVRLADGGCQITWVLYNGFCDNAGVRPVCPAIDGQMIIHQAADGSWATNIEEDKYPSRGIYLWNGSTFVKACPNCERAETIFLDLYSLRKNTDSLRLEQSRIPKPSNCEPQ